MGVSAGAPLGVSTFLARLRRAGAVWAGAAAVSAVADVAEPDAAVFDMGAASGVLAGLVTAAVARRERVALAFAGAACAAAALSAPVLSVEA